MSELDPFLAKRELEVGGTYYALSALDDAGISTKHLPYSMRVLLEGALRNCDGFLIREEDVKAIAGWEANGERGEIPFRPSRVILQDFTGVPAVVATAVGLVFPCPHEVGWVLIVRRHVWCIVSVATTNRVIGFKNPV